MKQIWILVADSSRARVYTADSGLKQLEEINGLVHSEARMHEQAITADMPGRMSGSVAGSRHAYEDHTPVKDQEKAEFAREVAAVLEQGRQQGRYSKLALMAAPDFLGVLRQHLSAQTRKMVVEEVNKNLTKGSIDDIRSHLPRHFISVLDD